MNHKSTQLSARRLTCRTKRISRIGLFHLINTWCLRVVPALLVSLAGLLATADDQQAPASAPMTSLEQAKAYALLHNPGVKAAFERWQSALENIPQAQAFPDPRVSYTYYVENVETRVGPQEQAFALVQTLPWFGKRELRGDVASSAADAVRQEYEQAKLDLLYGVKDAYYKLYFLSRAISITRENMQLLESLEKVAQSRYKTGGPMLPLIQLQTELGKLEDRLNAFRALRPARVARLNAVLNRRPDAEIPWPDTIHVPERTLNDRNLYAQLQEKSPMLKRFDAQAEKYARASDLARKQRWPDVSLGVKYVDTGEGLRPGTPGSGTDPVMATVSINLPIWTSKYAAAEAEAKFSRQAVLSAQTDMRNQLLSKLEMALFRYRDAGRKIDLYRDTLIPKANQSLSVAREAFEGGEADFLSLIDAERMLLEFELQFEKARAARARRLAEIEMLTGKEVDIAKIERE